MISVEGVAIPFLAGESASGAYLYTSDEDHPEGELLQAIVSISVNQELGATKVGFVRVKGKGSGTLSVEDVENNSTVYIGNAYSSTIIPFRLGNSESFLKKTRSVGLIRAFSDAMFRSFDDAVRLGYTETAARILKMGLGKTIHDLGYK